MCTELTGIKPDILEGDKCERETNRCTPGKENAWIIHCCQMLSSRLGRKRARRARVREEEMTAGVTGQAGRS